MFTERHASIPLEHTVTVLQILAAAVVLVLLLARRARPREVSRSSLRQPAILTLVGVLLLHDVVLTGASASFLVLTAVLAVGLGAARGAVTRVRHTAEGTFSSWGPAAFALIGVLVAVRVGVDAGALALGVPSSAVSSSVLAALGLSLLAEQVVVRSRVGLPLTLARAA